MVYKHCVKWWHGQPDLSLFDVQKQRDDLRLGLLIYHEEETNQRLGFTLIYYEVTINVLGSDEWEMNGR